MINPMFTAWLEGQSQEVEDAIQAKWDELQTDPSIPSGPKADYARKALLLKFARTHGYS